MTIEGPDTVSKSDRRALTAFSSADRVKVPVDSRNLWKEIRSVQDSETQPRASVKEPKIVTELENTIDYMLKLIL